MIKLMSVGLMHMCGKRKISKYSEDLFQELLTRTEFLQNDSLVENE